VFRLNRALRDEGSCELPGGGDRLYGRVLSRRRRRWWWWRWRYRRLDDERPHRRQLGQLMGDLQQSDRDECQNDDQVTRDRHDFRSQRSFQQWTFARAGDQIKHCSSPRTARAASFWLVREG
jgi:hypothetical protein